MEGGRISLFGARRKFDHIWVYKVCAQKYINLKITFTDICILSALSYIWALRSFGSKNMYFSKLLPGLSEYCQFLVILGHCLHNPLCLMLKLTIITDKNIVGNCYCLHNSLPGISKSHKY